MSATSSPSCCPEGSLPPLKGPLPHVGKVIDVSSSGTVLKAYATGHGDLASASHIVLVLSDVYGFDSGRHFQFADRLADLLNTNELGVFSGKVAVLIPDVFRGSPPFKVFKFMSEAASGILCAPGFIFKLKTRGAEYYLSPIYDVLLPWLKSRGADAEKTRLSWVGFCFGGWLGPRCFARSENAEGATDSFRWGCGVGIHPSFFPERYAGESDEALAESIKENKILLMPAGNDSVSLKPGGSVVKILADGQSVPESDVSVPFENMIHGFCTRGDPCDEEKGRAQKLAEETAAKYILKWGSG